MKGVEFSKKLIEKYGFEKGTVLDLGAGNGQMLLGFKEKGFEVLGLDRLQYHEYLNVKRGDFNELPLPYESESVDYILMSFSLRFVNDWHSFLRECYRILRKNGRFILYDTKGVCIRCLDYSPFYHTEFKRYPFYAFYPYSRVLLIAEKFEKQGDLN